VAALSYMTVKSLMMAIYEGDTLTLKATQNAKILFLGGEPINEPVVGYGPLVMNSMPEIQLGKMGQMI
jgi:redox-sensitive bicupin YhaK (pirin superfamily)